MVELEGIRFVLVKEKTGNRCRFVVEEIESRILEREDKKSLPISRMTSSLDCAISDGSNQSNARSTG